MAVDTIQVGGTSGGWPVSDLATLSRETGGVSSTYSDADRATARIAEATAFEYLLGYYPVDATLDGTFRRVEITVNRPHVTVLYRHGYFAREARAPLNSRQLASYSRIVGALNDTRPLKDVGIVATAAYHAGAARSTAVHVTVDPSRLALAEAAGVHTGSIDVAIFCGDGRQQMVGASWHTADLRLDADAYTRLERTGLVIDEQIPVKAP